MNYFEGLKAIVLSGLAAFLAYAFNRWAVGRYGEEAIRLLIPIVEEGLKTGFAIKFAAPLLAVHVSFGFLEATYDYLANPGVRPAGRGLASLAALAGHTVFGGITALLIAKGLGPLLGIIITGLLHSFWNMSILHRT